MIIRYGIFRFCLFKFAPSMQTMLTFLLAGLATFHETYNRSISYAAASLATAPKYLLFPEQRAKKVCLSILAAFNANLSLSLSIVCCYFP